MIRFFVAAALSMASAAHANCKPPCLQLPTNQLHWMIEQHVHFEGQESEWRKTEISVSASAGPNNDGQAYFAVLWPSRVEATWQRRYYHSYGVLNSGRGFWENATLTYFVDQATDRWKTYCRKETTRRQSPSGILAFYAGFTEHCGIDVACPAPFEEYYDQRFKGCDCYHRKGESTYSMWTVHNPTHVGVPMMLSNHPDAPAFDDDATFDDATNMFITNWGLTANKENFDKLPCTPPATMEGATALRGSALEKGDPDILGEQLALADPQTITTGLPDLS